MNVHICNPMDTLSLLYIVHYALTVSCSDVVSAYDLSEPKRVAKKIKIIVTRIESRQLKSICNARITQTGHSQ